MADTLLLGGRIHAHGIVGLASAMLVVDGRVAWVGGDEAALALGLPTGTRRVQLDGRLVTPAFVDAHVHLTATGIAMSSLDLASAESNDDVLRRVAERCAVSVGIVHGVGWDESAWPLPMAPTADELERVAPGRAVLLRRADLHSAVASRAYLDLVPDIRSMHGCNPVTGRLEGPAGSAASDTLLEALGVAGRDDARRAALRAAAAAGIGAVHEMGGPLLGGRADLRETSQLTGTDEPAVVTYWGQLGGEGISTALQLRARPGGDLFVDGSVGSASAYLRERYADADTRGSVHLTAAEVRDHVVACAEVNAQTAFHAIGDGALDVVLAGFEEAAAVVGESGVRRGGHRLEHLVMAHPEHIAAMARLGIIASMQPAFDARWGGENGLYERRLGPTRASLTHPLRSIAGAGVPMAFGSDSPVTPIDPWAGVRAAASLHHASERLTVRAAFLAHTRGGWRAAGLRSTVSTVSTVGTVSTVEDGAGVLAPGSPATYAIWDAGELVVAAPDRKVAAWSTDPRSGVAGLPDLSDQPPACLATVRDGHPIYQHAGFDGLS